MKYLLLLALSLPLSAFGQAIQRNDYTTNLPSAVNTNMFVKATNGTAAGLTTTGTLTNANSTNTGTISAAGNGIIGGNLQSGPHRITNSGANVYLRFTNGLFIFDFNGVTPFYIDTNAANNSLHIDSDSAVRMMYATEINNETVTNYTRRKVTALGLTTNIDLATGTHFTITLLSNTSLQFSNPPAAGYSQDVEIDVTVGASAFTLTWSNNANASVFWPGGITPVQSTNSLMDRWNINFVGSNGHGAVLQRYTQ